MIPHAAGYYNSHSQHEQKLRTASALPIDLFGLTGFSTGSVKIIYLMDYWLVDAAMRSSDPNCWQSADCRKSGSLEPEMFTRKRSVQNNCRSCFCASQKWWFQTIRENVSRHKVQLLRSCVFDYSESCVFDFSEMPTLIFNRLNPRNGPPCPCTSFLVSSIFLHVHAVELNAVFLVVFTNSDTVFFNLLLGVLAMSVISSTCPCNFTACSTLQVPFLFNFHPSVQPCRPLS